jgi:hypothetical protein
MAVRIENNGHHIELIKDITGEPHGNYTDQFTFTARDTGLPHR